MNIFSHLRGDRRPSSLPVVAGIVTTIAASTLLYRLHYGRLCKHGKSERIVASLGQLHDGPLRYGVNEEIFFQRSGTCASCLRIRLKKAASEMSLSESAGASCPVSATQEEERHVCRQTTAGTSAYPHLAWAHRVFILFRASITIVGVMLASVYRHAIRRVMRVVAVTDDSSCQAAGYATVPSANDLPSSNVSGLRRCLDDMMRRHLRPSPGRVPTVVVIRAPMGYDVTLDAIAVWNGIQQDPCVCEEGLVDIVVVEEGLASTPWSGIVAVSQTSEEGETMRSYPSERLSPTAPIMSSCTKHLARMTIEVCRAEVFFSYLYRAALLQEKDVLHQSLHSSAGRCGYSHPDSHNERVDHSFPSRVWERIPLTPCLSSTANCAPGGEEHMARMISLPLSQTVQLSSEVWEKVFTVEAPADTTFGPASPSGEYEERLEGHLLPESQIQYRIRLVKQGSYSVAALREAEQLTQRTKQRWKDTVEKVPLFAAEEDSVEQIDGKKWSKRARNRRASMRVALMRELQEHAFLITSIPLPDMRVYQQLPPCVPRYIAAHARGFRLYRTHAEEMLHQQAALRQLVIASETPVSHVDALSNDARPLAHSTHESYTETKRHENVACPVTPSSFVQHLAAQLREWRGTWSMNTVASGSIHTEPLMRSASAPCGNLTTAKTHSAQSLLSFQPLGGQCCVERHSGQGCGRVPLGSPPNLTPISTSLDYHSGWKETVTSTNTNSFTVVSNTMTNPQQLAHYHSRTVAPHSGTAVAGLCSFHYVTADTTSNCHLGEGRRSSAVSQDRLPDAQSILGGDVVSYPAANAQCNSPQPLEGSPPSGALSMGLGSFNGAQDCRFFDSVAAITGSKPHASATGHGLGENRRHYTFGSPRGESCELNGDNSPSNVPQHSFVCGRGGPYGEITFVTSALLFYYTFADASACLFNASVQPPSETDTFPEQSRQRSPDGASASGRGMNPSPFRGSLDYSRPRYYSSECTSGRRCSTRLSSSFSVMSSPQAPFQTSFSINDAVSSYYDAYASDENAESDEQKHLSTEKSERNGAFHATFAHLHEVFFQRVMRRATTCVGLPNACEILQLHRSQAFTATFATPNDGHEVQWEVTDFAGNRSQHVVSDIHQPQFGLTPFDVWLATRYSRHHAAEVYLMDVISCKGDPFLPTTRVIDEVTAHAVLVYHQGSLRDFLEELKQHFGLTYTPQTSWGRQYLGFTTGDATPSDESTKGVIRQSIRTETLTPTTSSPMTAIGTLSTGFDAAGPEGDTAAAAVASEGMHGEQPDALDRGDMRSAVVCDNARVPANAGLVSLDGTNRDGDIMSPRQASGRSLSELWRYVNLDEEEDEDLFDAPPCARCRRPFEAKHVDGSCDGLQEEAAVEERLLLREMEHVKAFLLEHRHEFSSAMLTPLGSNHLEDVFGVPATVFPFLLCARESVALVYSIYESLEDHYGPLTFEHFSAFAKDVFSRDRPEIVRHAPRIFRTLNKSRKGCITYEELCGWMARKLSCGSNIKPDAHVVATAMSLRLPMALLLRHKHMWPYLECALASLSDGEGEY